jgi:hypothetical protein
MQTENDGAYEMGRESSSGTVATVLDAPTQSITESSQVDGYRSAKNPLIARLLRWLFPEQRRSNRFTVPNLLAFLGSVRNAKPYEIGDVSTSGCYMITRERWLPGTVLPVTLLRTKTTGNDTVTTITLQSTVVRSGPDGVGFAFFLDEHMTEKLAGFLEGLTVWVADEPDMMRAS